MFFRLISFLVLLETFFRANAQACPALRPGVRCDRRCFSNIFCNSPMSCICTTTCDGFTCTNPRNILCEDLPAINNGRLVPVLNHRSPGDDITFECNVGYQLSFTSIRVCRVDGSWSGSSPVCSAGKCPDFGEFENGFFSLSNGYDVGSVASYSCNKGYKLKGSEVVTCGSDFNWSHPTPSCSSGLEDFCNQRPPSLVNGKYQFVVVIPPGADASFAPSDIRWRIGDKMKYSCNRGFSLNTSNPVWTCVEKDTWSGQAMSCLPCTPLPSDADCGTPCQANYECGANSICSCYARRCGEASCFLPSSQCPELQNIPNGKVRSVGRGEGALASYDCEKGYALVGSKTRRCLKEDWIWSGSKPRCAQKTKEFCENPPNLVNGIYRQVSIKPLPSRPPNGASAAESIKIKWSIGDTVQYRCNAGFNLNSTNPIWTCIEANTWSGAPMSCFACTPLPENLRCGRTCDDSSGCNQNEICSCHQRKCGGRTCFVPPAPLKCPQPTSIRNGGVRHNGLVQGSAAVYFCHSSFTMVGIHTRICLADLTWSGEQPRCDAKGFCGSPPPVPNGWYKLVQDQFGNSVGENAEYYQRYAVGDKFQYGCSRGYQLSSSVSTKTCLSGGTWSGDNLQCIKTRLECERLTDIANGVITLLDGTITPGSTVRYDCVRGFQMVGDNFRTCQRDGSWSGIEPTCVKVKGFCWSPPSIYNGWYKLVGDQSSGTIGENADINKRYAVGDVFQYGCIRGYRLNSDITKKKCLNDGNWDGVSLQCIKTREKCHKLSMAILNGVAQKDNVVGPGSIVSYLCNRGYTLVGDRQRTCQNDGTWSGREPSCLRSQATPFCWSPPPIINGWYKLVGDLSASNAAGNNAEVNVRYTVGDVFQYGCKAGFVLTESANDKKTCLPDGTWSGSLVQCREVLDCGFGGLLSNGHSTVIGWGPGSVASYTCHPGYNLVGSSRRTCQIDGNYDGIQPTCVPIGPQTFCPVPEPPNNGFLSLCRSCSLNSGSQPRTDVLSYACAFGYTLVGPRKRTCMPQTGKWNYAAPVCVFAGCTVSFEIPNGFVVSNSLLPNAQIEIRCDRGFQLDKVDPVYCEGNQVWSTALPNCVPQTASNNPWTLSISDKSFLFGNELLSFYDSERFCFSKGGWLATSGVREEKLYKKLKDYMTPGHSYWFGLTDHAEESFWLWKTGDVLHPEMYDPELLEALGTLKAFTSDDNNDCAFVSNDFQRTWNDDDCQKGRHYALCEKATLNNWVATGSGIEQMTIPGQIQWMEALARCRAYGGWLLMKQQIQIVTRMVAVIRARLAPQNHESKSNQELILNDAVCERGGEHQYSQENNMGEAHANPDQHASGSSTPTVTLTLTDAAIVTTTTPFHKVCGPRCDTNQDCGFTQKCLCDGPCSASCLLITHPTSVCCPRSLPRRTCGPACVHAGQCRAGQHCSCDGRCGLSCRTLIPSIGGRMEQPGTSTVTEGQRKADSTTQSSYSTEGVKGDAEISYSTKGSGSTKGAKGSQISFSTKGAKGLVSIKVFKGDDEISYSTNAVKGSVSIKGFKGDDEISSSTKGAKGPDSTKGAKGSQFSYSTNAAKGSTKGFKGDDEISYSTKAAKSRDSTKGAKGSQFSYSTNAAKGSVSTKGFKGDDEISYSTKAAKGPDSTKGAKGSQFSYSTKAAKGSQFSYSTNAAKGSVSTKGFKGDDEISYSTKGAKGPDFTKGAKGSESSYSTKGAKGSVSTKGFKGDDEISYSTKGAKGPDFTKGAKGSESFYSTKGAKGSVSTKGFKGDAEISFSTKGAKGSQISYSTKGAKGSESSTEDGVSSQQVPLTSVTTEVGPEYSISGSGVSSAGVIGSTVVLDNNVCLPSPCENECICSSSCKHEGGYYCRPPLEKEGFLGRNCSHRPPQIDCGADAVMVIRLEKSLMIEYDGAHSNGVFYVDASTVADQAPVSVFTVNSRCYFRMSDTADFYTIQLDLYSCTTTVLHTGSSIIFLNRIWWDRFTENRMISFVRPVAEVTCSYPTEYIVQSAIAPFCCDPLPRKTELGTFLLRSVLHKNPPNTGKPRLLVNSDQPGVATYTVGEMIYLTVTLDLGPKMSSYDEDETKVLYPRLTMCWFARQRQSSGPESNNMIIYPTDQPAIKVWGPESELNVVDIGFQVVQWKNDSNYVYVHCSVKIYSMNRAKRSIDDDATYNEVIIKGPLRIVYKDTIKPRRYDGEENYVTLNLNSFTKPMLVTFAILLFLLCLVLVALLKFHLVCNQTADNGEEPLDFHDDRL